MSSNKPKARNLAGIGTLLALLSCYGTLALISILGTLGIVIAVNNAIWAGATVAFAVLAVIGLGMGRFRHRKPWPVIIGILGATIISYTMFVHYNHMVEIAGFGLLSLAALWDWRLKPCIKSE